MQYPKFKVNVYCATFQHAKYITDAMNGFTMQQTDFPFVCTIIDDASTDGEQDVIKQYVEEHFDLSEDGVAYKKETDYAHIIYARHKTNKNCYFAVLFLKENHYSQKKDRISYLKEWRENVDYIAMCEGDDYWIDPLKLQKQVKFLDENTEYGMVYSKCKVQNESICKYNIQDMGQQTNYKYLLCNINVIPTASTLVKKDIYNKYIDEIHPEKYNWKMGDYPLWLYTTMISKIYFIDDATCVYRILQNSASHSSDERRIFQYYYSIFDVKLFFYNYSKCENPLVLDKICKNYIKILIGVLLRTKDAEIKRKCNSVFKMIKSKRDFSALLIKWIITHNTNALFSKIAYKLLLHL